MAPLHAVKDTASLADFLQILRLRKALITLILALVVITPSAVIHRSGSVVRACGLLGYVVLGHSGILSLLPQMRHEGHSRAPGLASKRPER